MGWTDEMKFNLYIDRYFYVTSLYIKFFLLYSSNNHIILFFYFCITVEPRYFELGWFEVSAISKEDRMPLDLPLCFQSFTISYFELGYFEFPAISNSSFFPYTLNQPR